MAWLLDKAFAVTLLQHCKRCQMGSIEQYLEIQAQYREIKAEFMELGTKFVGSQASFKLREQNFSHTQKPKAIELAD
ncbi:hypothetical protein HW132_32275 [Brasilonema sp. CT11]|nr:hypothetical protein [Brasilonema sp. CT11]